MVAARPITTPLTDSQLSALDRARDYWRLTDDAHDILVKQAEQAPPEEREILICGADAEYFIRNHCYIYDAQEADWIIFDLWPEQVEVLNIIRENQLSIALKARQIGITWLCLCYALWLLLFRPIATVMLFSMRDDEAIALLERLNGIYRRLPRWLQALEVLVNSAHRLKLSNGSEAYAFPTTAGDSYTASFVLVDEADLIPDLNRLMGKVKPTIDAGGKMALVSRSNKKDPASEFKNIYNAAKQKLNKWAHIFLPWYVHPGRDQAWYEDKKQDIQTRTGSLDELKEQYPATDTEALSANSSDKRLAEEWVEQCAEVREPFDLATEMTAAPAINGLRVYEAPIPGDKYSMGIDSAEGNPTSNDSVIKILKCSNAEEVCSLSGKYEPGTTGAHAITLATWYNNAAIMPERQNHGHAVIQYIEQNSNLKVMEGWDSKRGNKKYGWNSNSLGKIKLYDFGAEMFRDNQTIVHTFSTVNQIKSIEGSALRAPPNMHDDEADAHMLALVGIPQAEKIGKGPAWRPTMM